MRAVEDVQKRDQPRDRTPGSIADRYFSLDRITPHGWMILSTVGTVVASLLTLIHGTLLPFILVAPIQALLLIHMWRLHVENQSWNTRYRNLLNAISSAVVISDAEGNLAEPHSGVAHLTGMDWPQYRGTGWLNAIHPDDRSQIFGGGNEHEIRVREPQSGDWHWYLLRSVRLPGANEWISIVSDIHAGKLAAERHDILVNELRHRLKNLMSVIGGIATSSKPQSEQAVDLYVRKFLGRLQALSTAGDLMLANGHNLVEAGDVARATLRPFMEDTPRRIQIAGPKLVLSEETGGALGLGIHELATNAIKYGALSVPDGTVTLVWQIEPQGHDERITIEWKESGGPPVAIPLRQGFGTRILQFVPAREKNGGTAIEYQPDGLYVRIGFVRKIAGATQECTAEIKRAC
jgi:two-component sensor histidine kinase